MKNILKNRQILYQSINQSKKYLYCRKLKVIDKVLKTHTKTAKKEHT